MCSDCHKNLSFGQQKPEGTSSVMFEVGTAAKCCEFKRYVLRIDSMLHELREVSELLSCDMHWVFLLGKRVQTVAKTMVMEKKTDQKALALLCLA